MSQGLFQGVIAMSGSPTTQLPIVEHQLDLAKMQASLVNCSTINTIAMVKCLQEVPTEDFENTLNSLIEANGTPVVLFTPVIERDFGQERFLPDHPINLLKAQNFTKMPVITGITQNEYISLAHGEFLNSKG